MSKREQVLGAWIDLKTWKRREHYQLFRRYQQPCFSVTVDVDVTRLWKQCRKPGAATFFLTSLFLLLRAVNDVEAFRLRLRPQGVWRHERVSVGPTIPLADHTFAFARLELADDLDRFVALSEAALAKARDAPRLEVGKPSDDVVYHSVLPWFRFTGYTNALPGNDSIPRIVFGRAVPDGRKVTMPVAVEVHHALVDGLDVAKFFERFSEELDRRSSSVDRPSSIIDRRSTR